MEKQTEKQVNALKSLKSLNLSIKEDNELREIGCIFIKNLLTDLIKCKVLEIIKLQEINKSDGLDYKSAHRKIHNFSQYSLH